MDTKRTVQRVTRFGNFVASLFGRKGRKTPSRLSKGKQKMQPLTSVTQTCLSFCIVGDAEKLIYS